VVDEAIVVERAACCEREHDLRDDRAELRPRPCRIYQTAAAGSTWVGGHPVG
jgi:hypothetical protein